MTELHGTELGMLREIDAGAAWPFAAEWAERMRRWAAGSRALLVAPGIADEAAERLAVPRERFVELPGGVDLELFDRRAVDRVAFWRRWLVAEPQGWDESGIPGTVRYAQADLEPIEAGRPLVLFVGRYTAVKRLPLLLRAHARVQGAVGDRVPLVLVGGHPGEFEGEHPLQLAHPGVFLAGWHAHDDLADAINASDLVVLPSRHEAFGLVLAEAMACGVPVVATASQGPSRIVDDGETGWLVPVDDEDALTAALVEAVGDEAERRRRGGLARERARARYGEVGRRAERPRDARPGRDGTRVRPCAGHSSSPRSRRCSRSRSWRRPATARSRRRGTGTSARSSSRSAPAATRPAGSRPSR